MDLVGSAGDSQIYVSLKRADSLSLKPLLNCLDEGCELFSFNDKKTEVMVFDDPPPSLFGFHGTVGQTSCEWSGGKSGNERLPDEAADKNQRFSPKAAL